MKITVEVPWERDLSKNHNRLPESAHRNYKRHVLAWMERLGWEVKLQMMQAGMKAFEPPVMVVVDFYYPNNRKRDDHNYYETICDALKGVVGMDDDQIRISTGVVEARANIPGFMIQITDVEE